MTTRSDSSTKYQGRSRWSPPQIWQAASILLALAGQIIILSKTPSVGVLFIATAIILFIWSLIRSPESELPLPAHSQFFQPFRPLTSERSFRTFFLIACLAAMAIAYVGFAGNNLTGGFGAWIAAIIFFLLAFLEIPVVENGQWHKELSAWWHRIDKPTLIILLGITLLAILFRFYRLSSIPGEMTSDHAEKLQDVQDVLNGMRPIFFGRNTGREGFQFYLTALLIRILPLSANQLALQIGTGIFGVMAIPFTYLLGKELYHRNVGIFAAFFLAISHWHVAITRVGLRFPFTAAFATPAIYYLFRALRMNNRNAWLAAGFFLGLGLHTYTAMRIVPVIFICLTLVKFILDGIAKKQGIKMESASSWNREFVINAILSSFFTLLLFLPLLRFAIDKPESFWFRSLSRATKNSMVVSTDLLENLILNIKNGLLMFNFKGDVVPINTIPDTPALGIVTGALFILGIAYLVWRLFRWRDRRSLYLIITLFLLLMPSILSLSYPEENPSFVRSGGAVAVVMIIVGLPLAIFINPTISNSNRMGKIITLSLVVILGISALLFNYRYYFDLYAEHTLRSLWNSTEMGAVLRDFQSAGGNLENAYHVPYPHWVDTRNIGINAGDPYWANRLEDKSDLEEHISGEKPRIYILFPDDELNRQLLAHLFPDGKEELYDSQREGKDFLIFHVPE